MVGRRLKFFFLFPAVIWVLFFTIFPLIYSLRLSFFKVSVGQSDVFVGLQNFIRTFHDERAIEAAITTLIFVVVAVTLEMVIGLAVALLFNVKNMSGKSTMRGLLTLPIFATPVAVGYLFFTMFYEEGGLFNAYLPWQIPWLSDPRMALLSVIIVDIWKWAPFTFIVLLAALQSIPEEMFEAVQLDTSSRWDVFRYLTLPILQPTLVIVTLLRLTEAFKIFDIPFSLTGGGPGTATQPISMYIHITGLRYFDLGYASAMSYLLLMVVTILVISFFGRIRQAYED